MNYSKQRELILNYLKSVDTHPTADIIYNQLRSEHLNISLGTVYRNLDTLSQKKMILRLQFANDKDRFDGNTSHHYHGVCKICNKVEDIFIDYFLHIDKKAQENIDFKIESHELFFNIICSDCK